MKTLYLVRHAEATPGNLALRDHERPLNERGRREAAAMGQRLAQRGALPGLVLASSATRARTTAELLAQALGLAPERIVVNERLYNASASELLGAIASLGQSGDAHPRVMLVAHNPGLTDLAHHFASDITHLPTCAVVELTFDTPSWADLDAAVPTQAVLSVPNPP